jgi:hypothetical protein
MLINLMRKEPSDAREVYWQVPTELPGERTNIASNKP